MSEEGISKYDYMKACMKQIETPLDPITVMTNLDEIADKVINFSNYYMLLCKERSDYTVIHLTHKAPAEEEKKLFKELLLDCFQSRGAIIDMRDGVEDNSWEIWLRDTITNEDVMYILFNYSFGVEEI